MTKFINTDITILGGGLTGLSLACVLGTAGIEVICVDRETPETTLTEKFDGRTTAISMASRRVLEAGGVWTSLKKHACPIKDIRVADGTSPLYLHFDIDDVEGEAFGWIIENRIIRKALYERAAKLKSVTLLAPETAKSFEYKNSHVEVSLPKGKINTRLLIGADGRASPVREWLGIETVGWRYKQSAIVCCAEHEMNHENVAVEHFMPAGPFAVLPMTDANGRHRSSIVWTEHGGDAGATIKLSVANFNKALQDKFGDSLGKVKLTGGRYVFPLGLQHAKKYIGPRTAIIGEAAHVMHPIAGQGLNMSLRDVATLAELIADHLRLGLDPGSATLLEKYQRWRKRDNMAMLFATDGLNKLFSNDMAPVRIIRDLGLGLVERTPPVKKFFMKQAMGMTGNLPRIVRGESL